MQSGNLEFKTTGVEDTHLALAAISFKVEVNNFLILLLLQIFEEKICQVSVPV